MAEYLTYLASPRTVDTLFSKIITAAVPDRFTKEFVEKTLGIKGGTGAATIPFLKRLGLLNTDGSPNDNYKKFRNPSASANILGKCIKNTYSEIYRVNENAHNVNDNDLKGIIVQITGLPADSRTVELTISTFKNLKKYAKFDSSEDEVIKEKIETAVADTEAEEQTIPSIPQVNLSYTIYLNLPNTNDISVFNAIFKSLRDNLLVK